MTRASTTSPHGDPLTPLLDVAAALVSSLVLEEALANVAARIGEAMSVSKVDIYAYDRERDALVYEARWDIAGTAAARKYLPGHVVYLSDRPTWRPVLAGELVEFSITDSALPPDERVIYEETGQKTTLDAPLMVGDEVIGVLGVVQKDHVRHFTPLERDFFRSLCQIAAIGISHAKAFREQQQCNRYVHTLLEAGRAATSGDVAAVSLARLARAAVESLGVARAEIHEYDHDAHTIVCRARCPEDPPVGAGPADAPAPPDAPLPLTGRLLEQRVLDDGLTRVEEADDEALPAERRREMSAAGDHVCLCSPLCFGDRTLGLLRLCDTRPGHRFTPTDRDLAEGLAAQAALILTISSPV